MNDQSVRIIAGHWRGRKILFAEQEGLRPTSDRIKETLFSWLMPYINDAVCLDLFAGSGALSFEAISRGAKSATLIELSPKVSKILSQQIEKLGAGNMTVVKQDAQKLIAEKDASDWNYDIIFLDPPYKMQNFKNLAAGIEGQLQRNSLGKKQCLIYFENNGAIDADDLPQDWQQLKYKKAGQVHFYLFASP